MTPSPAPNGATASGFFVLRTPLLSFDELLAWSGALEAPGTLDDPGRLATSLAIDRANLRARLAAVVMRPEIREALFIASPSLDESLDLWLREPERDRGQRVERAVVRYFARLAGRATPFGLFAGCSVGTLGDETQLALAGRTSYSRHTRLDMDYLFSLVDTLSHDPAVRRGFVYRPNSSLYHAAGRVRYVEGRVDGRLRSQHLVSMEATASLETTLERARDGATFESLAAVLVDEDVSLADAEQYIDELVDSQVLVSDLAVPVTGENPMDVLIEDLRACATTSPSADVLSETRGLLAELDAKGLGQRPGRYLAAARLLEALPAKADVDRLFQVDLMKGAKNLTLGPLVLDEIVAGVEILRRLNRPPHHEALRRFREAFVDRYERREVPLVEVLDDEAGIGFGSAADMSPLLRGLTFPATAENPVPGTDRDTLLLGKLSDALVNGRQEIRLGSSDLDKLAAKEPLPFPKAFAVFAAVAASGDGALASGNFLVRLDGVEGPSGVGLLGRFCHADPALRAHVEEHLRAEEALDSDAVFAEIVHLPEGRLGNILFRPVLRTFEIPYLGRSGVPRERQIPISDLMVSVRGEEIILRSASLNRRIIPRLTTAHDFRWRSVGVYRFLCSLQSQEPVVGGWDWGVLARAPFLPRIVTRRLVLARARWRVGKEELERLGNRTGRQLFEAVQHWRAERQLPRWIVLADADNMLAVDLDNILSIESFADLVKARDEAVLLELFPASDQLCAHDPDGRFVHELVVPFVCKEHAPTKLRWMQASLDEHGTRAAERRSFPPGSQWLYIKLYSGTATVDPILREIAGPCVREAMSAGVADRWFFIRYSDPAPHLRLRLHGDAAALQRAVWPALQAAIGPWLEDGRIWRVVLDTYEREVERYGGAKGIVLAERLFHADSEAVLEIVELLDPGDSGLDERWRLTLCGMDRLLDDLGIELVARRSMLLEARAGFGKEFRADRALDRQIGETFRRERSNLSDLLDHVREGDDSPLAPGLEILGQRSERLRPIVAELKACEAAGRLSGTRHEIAMSYLHMHANRLLRSVQREQELVLYDFLARHYKSALARTKTSRTGREPSSE